MAAAKIKLAALGTGIYYASTKLGRLVQSLSWLFLDDANLMYRSGPSNEGTSPTIGLCQVA
jgi:hypothetical protein